MGYYDPSGPYPGFGPTFVAQGWQCPVCRTVYSPSMAVCTCCTKPSTLPVTGTGVRPLTVSKGVSPLTVGPLEEGLLP